MLPKSKAATINESDVVMYLATGWKHIRLMALLMSLSLMLGVNFYIYSRSVYFARSIIHYQNMPSPVDDSTVFNDNNERLLTLALSSSTVQSRTCRRLGFEPTVVEFPKHIKGLPKIRRNAEKDFTCEVYAYSLDIARNWTRIALEEYLNRQKETRLENAELKIKNSIEYLSQAKDRMDRNANEKFTFQQRNDLDKIIIEMDSLKQIPQQLTVLHHRLTMMEGVLQSLSNAPDVVSKLSLLSSMEKDPSSRFMENDSGKSLQISVGQQYLQPTTNDDNTNTPPNYAVVTPSMTQPVGVAQWEAYDHERHRLEHELQIKGQHLLAGHPQIRELNHQLAEVNKKLDVEYSIAIDTFNMEYSNRLGQKLQLEAKLPEYNELNRKNAKLINEYSTIDSSSMFWKKYYKDMSASLDNLDFGMDKERIILQFGGHVDAPSEPVAPKRSMIILYSCIIGFILAIAVPFGMEYLSSRISDMEHAEEVLRIRGLGVVPKITDVPFDRLLLEDEKSDHHLKESFRLIRTNLVVNSESGSLPQVILITSSMPQEGKTSVSANLALSFASKGEKTLLIDGDLRRGRLHKLFSCDHKPGLSNLLSGQVGLDQICHVVGHENLTIMPCGKHLNTASELLDSNTFGQLMTELRGKYQRIIVDSPPVLGLSETLIMQRFADGVLMVIWSDFTPLSSVKSSIQSLSVNGAKFCGFVLNRLDFTALTNRYKYFYYAPLYYANYQPLPAPASTPTRKID
jgi:capsular exopolysaccharide synthesis family protein